MPENQESFIARVQAQMEGRKMTAKNLWDAVITTAAASQTEVSQKVQTVLDGLLKKGGVLTDQDKEDVLAVLQAEKKKEAVRQVRLTGFVFVTATALTLTGVWLYFHFKKK